MAAEHIQAAGRKNFPVLLESTATRFDFFFLQLPEYTLMLAYK